MSVKSRTDIAFHIDNVAKMYGGGDNGFYALRSASLDIYDGEFFTLLGPSGCGKTTLLRMIAGFDYPTSGEIFLYGENIGALPPFKRPVNTVFQNYALFPHMTVAENIAFGCKMLRWPKDEIAAQVEKMLELVQLQPLAGRQTSMISGGQQQRVALARALAPHPKVLLLDEPLSALDYKLRKDMQVELKQLQRQTGITFIFVTHDQEEALTMSDRMAVMAAGEILQIGEPKEIYQSPANRFVANFIGETNFIDVDIVSCVHQIAQVKIGHDVMIEATLTPNVSPEGRASMALRPEHVSLSRQRQGLKAKLEAIVYLGTDTHFHARLEDGQKIIVRQQNQTMAQEQWNEGDIVTLHIPSGVTRLFPKIDEA